MYITLNFIQYILVLLILNLSTTNHYLQTCCCQRYPIITLSYKVHVDVPYKKLKLYKTLLYLLSPVQVNIFTIIMIYITI